MSVPHAGQPPELTNEPLGKGNCFMCDGPIAADDSCDCSREGARSGGWERAEAVDDYTRQRGLSAAEAADAMEAGRVLRRLRGHVENCPECGRAGLADKEGRAAA